MDLVGGWPTHLKNNESVATVFVVPGPDVSEFGMARGTKSHCFVRTKKTQRITEGWIDCCFFFKTGSIRFVYIYIYITIYDKFTLGPLCYHKQPACGWCMPVYYWDDSSLGSLANESIFRTFGTPKTSPDFLTDFLIGGDWNMFYFSIYWE